MRFFQLIVRLAACLGALMIVSCIDGREEYWLNEDGSGNAAISYTLPAVAATFQGGESGVDQLLANFLKSNAALTSSSHLVSIRDKRITVAVKFTFDSVMDLRKFSLGGSSEKLPPSADNLIGNIDLKLVGRQVCAERIIAVGKALPGASLLPSSQLEGHQLSYTVHLPVVASVSNATRTADGGRTLVWDFPLTDAVRVPQIIRFQAPVPIPLAWLVGAITVLMVLVMAIFVFVRRWRRNSRTFRLVDSADGIPSGIYPPKTGG